MCARVCTCVRMVSMHVFIDEFEAYSRGKAMLITDWDCLHSRGALLHKGEKSWAHFCLCSSITVKAMPADGHGLIWLMQRCSEALQQDGGWCPWQWHWCCLVPITSQTSNVLLLHHLTLWVHYPLLFLLAFHFSVSFFMILLLWFLLYFLHLADDYILIPLCFLC